MRKDVGKYTPVSLTSVSGAMMEEIILGTIEWCFKHCVFIWHSQNGFIKSWLADVMSFYNKVTCPDDDEKVVDTVFLCFHKAFGTVPHIILLDTLSNDEMNGFTVIWVKNWLKVRAQTVTVSGATPVWPPVTSSGPQGWVLGPVPFSKYLRIHH